MRLELASALADAVLMEGYALYPYRPTTAKNRYRWTFGVLAPRVWSEAGGCETWWLEAQLAIAGANRVAARLRAFQIERRDHWDEGVLQEVDFEIPAGEHATSFEWPADRDRCAVVGRIATTRERIGDVERLTIRIENLTPWADRGPRDAALARALASAHLIIGVDGGEIASAIDPPAWAVPCTSTATYPVLAGPPGCNDVALCAPFILYDHPQLAPESPGDLCDATEIDEILTLRTLTLTDEEKRAARETDPRAAAIVDRAESLTADQLARLHGARRSLSRGEMTPQWAPGGKVRLRPTRGTDAQDLLYAGRIATIAEVKHDVDGSVFLAVTIDDDPAAELHDWYGRYHHYRTDEVEPL